MKTKQLVVAFLLATTFFSCSKDDSVTPTNVSADLIGDWVLTDYHFNGSRRILDDINVNIITFSATAWELNVATNFSETPNDYKSNGFYNLDYIVIDENGDNFHFVDTQHIDEIGTWSRNNSFLGITVNGDLTQASISVLNGTTLMYAVSIETTETDENNQTVSIFRTDFYTFTRAGNN